MGQGPISKLKDTVQSGPLVLLSLQAMEKVGESGDAAEDPPQVEAPANWDGLCDSTGSLSRERDIHSLPA